jgi:anti-sigma regulatory factor (Ser/Thr protein kinase)
VAVQREFRAVPTSLPEVRAATRGWARSAGLDARAAVAAVHAVHEAVVNAIVHGYDGGSPDAVVRVEAAEAHDRLRFTITDSGAGFRPRRESPGLGLGLALIAQLADEFEVRDAAGGGLVVLIGFRLD